MSNEFFFKFAFIFQATATCHIENKTGKKELSALKLITQYFKAVSVCGQLFFVFFPKMETKGHIHR